MGEMPKTVFVTKYALTDGIKEREFSRYWMAGCAVVKVAGGLNGEMLLHKGDFALTSREAVERAETMKAKKLASLRKQIAKLEAMTFA